MEPSDGGQSLRVLAVDDEPTVTLLVSRVLQRGGYEVVTAASGEEAMALASRGRLDLLIVDKNLPRMNGFELVEQVRALHPNVPALIITATPEPMSHLPPGIDGYLAKPFRNLDALRNAVNEALERHRGASKRQELKQQLEQVVAQLRKA